MKPVDLADLVEVKSQTISAYEHNKGTPSPQVLEALSVRLRMPISFFTRPALNDATNPIFWRANSTATKIAQERAKVRLEWFHEITAYLREFFVFPSANVPVFGVNDDFRQITSDDIERASLQCREAWGLGLGPISDIVADLETNGIVGASMMMNAEKLDAFSQNSDIDETPYIVFGDDRANGCRRNFDAAHELGHLVLHKKVNQRRVNTPADWKLLEQQAHHFARAFLIPASSFGEELWMPSLEGFIGMKPKWQVSAQAMIFRCLDLELIDKTQSASLWINLNRRGWKKKEPLDDKLPKSRPSLVARSFEMIVEEKVKRPDQIEADLSLPLSVVEELASLPIGFLTGKVPAVTPLPKFKGEEQQAKSSLFESDNVVSLDRFKRR